MEPVKDVELVEDRIRPLISVICTVRNGGSTIRAVLDSVQSQTLRDWEMIIVDDGSSDDTSRILSQYAEKDPRIQFILTGGIGRGRALNLALANSRSDYVSNIDADDPCHPMRLEVQYEILRRSEQYAVIGTDTVMLFGDERPKWAEITPSMIENASVRDVTRTLARRCPVNHSSVLMKRSALIDVNGYDEGRKSQFDYDLWVRLAGAGHRIGRIALPLAGKRIHNRQQFERRRRVRFLAGSASVQYRAIRLLKGGPVDYLYLFARLLWGVLPNRFRMAMRQKLRSAGRR